MTLELIRDAIRAAQVEIATLLERTAIAAFIREKKNLYTALFGADGVFAVGSNVPIFGDICEPVFDKFPKDTMQQDDRYWYNYCCGSRGTVSRSNNQIFLALVFHEGRRYICFTKADAAFSSWVGRISRISA
ncbi:MAG TPA: hydantoinase B/oxoprolinase family protein, partial [Acetobacteraceae bacterium]